MSEKQKEDKKASINRKIKHYTAETKKIAPIMYRLIKIRKQTKVPNPELDVLIKTYREYERQIKALNKEYEAFIPFMPEPIISNKPSKQPDYDLPDAPIHTIDKLTHQIPGASTGDSPEEEWLKEQEQKKIIKILKDDI